jgi:hypothetical protein
MKDRSTVLFICPDFFDYKDILTKSLESRFDTVISFPDRPDCSAIEKALIKYNIFGFNSFKSYSYGRTIIRKLANSIPEITDVVIVKGTCLSSHFFHELRRINPSLRIVVYSWDSISNAKGFRQLAANSDIACSFDFSDCEVFGFRYLPLFSSKPHEVIHNELAHKIDYSVSIYEYCFVGSYHGDRAKILNRLVNASHSTKDSFIRIYFQSKLQYLFFYILDAELRNCPKSWVTFQPVDRHTIDSVSAKCERIIDIHHASQSGLTMRTWETLKGTGRLLTTNKFVLLHELPESVDILDRVTGKLWSHEEKLGFSTNLELRGNFTYSSLSVDLWLDELLK